MNEKVEIQIGTRRLVVEMEGLTPMEINAYAQKVSERLQELQDSNKQVADTSKLAMLVALSYCADLEKERSAHETTRRMLENSAERISATLRESLAVRAAALPEG
jgi:cell division protein ZapA (FtsZ GTPase activity inhibitor)